MLAGLDAATMQAFIVAVKAQASTGKRRRYESDGRDHDSLSGHKRDRYE